MLEKFVLRKPANHLNVLADLVALNGLGLGEKYLFKVATTRNFQHNCKWVREAGFFGNHRAIILLF